MTPTTGLQKPFTDEQLKAASQRPSWCKTCEANEMCPTLAKAVLVERYRLAARVLELEADNKRLREGLKATQGRVMNVQFGLQTNTTKASAANDLGVIANKIAAALKGGEI